VRRREFIRLFSGATLAWPISAHTQQSAEIKRIGVLMGTSDSDSDQKALVAIFTQALAELGWRDAQTFTLNIAGLPEILAAYPHLRQNSHASPQMLSLGKAPRLRGRYGRLPRQRPSCL
jgi:hypothetical protein